MVSTLWGRKEETGRDMKIAGLTLLLGEKTGERCVWGWDYWILEESRDSQTHQILNSPNDHSNQAPAGAWPVAKAERMMRNTT